MDAVFRLRQLVHSWWGCFCYIHSFLDIFQFDIHQRWNEGWGYFLHKSKLKLQHVTFCTNRHIVLTDPLGINPTHEKSHQLKNEKLSLTTSSSTNLFTLSLTLKEWKHSTLFGNYQFVKITSWTWIWTVYQAFVSNLFRKYYFVLGNQGQFWPEEDHPVDASCVPGRLSQC